MMYIGDFKEDKPVCFMWNTMDSDGASVTRSVDGTIVVYKSNSDGLGFDPVQVTTGITNDEDFDGVTGVHSCVITTTDAWYEVDRDYAVVLIGATIDGQVVNVLLATFSIDNRLTAGDIVAGIFDRVTEGTLTFEEMQRIGFAMLAGKSSGGCTDTAVFRDHADTKDRIIATVTAHGNRTAVVLDGSD